MKSNQYIFIIPFNKEQILFFNGLHKTFFLCKKSEEHSFVSLLKNPDLYEKTHISTLKKLTDSGFIIEDSYNEMNLLRSKRNSFIHSQEYKSTIIPTFECNYHCWYCIQDHASINPLEQKIELIIKHLKKYLILNNIKSYVLSWFGGEPLKEPDMINKISSAMLSFCSAHNIEYSGAITSNGSLLSHDIIKMLKDVNVNYYQIALDGIPEEHDKVKKDKIHSSSFALVLGNIVDLLETNENAQITLRINYTLKTLQSEGLVSEINRFIPMDKRLRMVVDLQKVWQINESSVPMELLVKLEKDFSDNGYILSTNHIFSMCYVDKEHYNMIYYNGCVEKCDDRTMDKLRGWIDEQGNIKWKENPVFPKYDVLDENSCCVKCSYYPLCYCSCPVQREKKINSYGKIVCGYNNDSKVFEHRILDFCWRSILNAELRNNTKIVSNIAI
jgi:uncharacterized protein